MNSKNEAFEPIPDSHLMDTENLQRELAASILLQCYKDLSSKESEGIRSSAVDFIKSDCGELCCDRLEIDHKKAIKYADCMFEAKHADIAFTKYAGRSSKVLAFLEATIKDFVRGNRVKSKNPRVKPSGRASDYVSVETVNWFKSDEEERAVLAKVREKVALVGW